MPGLSSPNAAWGDYDNDGDLDLVLSGYAPSGYTLTLWRNDQGSFAATLAGLPQGVWVTPLWIDFDRDSDLDLTLLSYNPLTQASTVEIWRNDAGVFSKWSQTLPASLNSKLAWGDLDQDGDLDLLISGFGDRDPIRQWRRDGNLFSVLSTGVIAKNFALGDFDGDGDLDLLGHEPAGLRLWHNQGGVFHDSGAAFSDIFSEIFPVVLLPADYDNDGDLDFLVSGRIGLGTAAVPLAKIYRNDGAGFTPLGSGLPGESVEPLAWGDFDNDGDLDLLIEGWRNISIRTRIYRNENGTFSDSGIGFGNLSARAGAWGDYDNDGDLDLLLAGTDSSASITELWRNEGVTANTPPEAPNNLSSSLSGSKIIFNWTAATDGQTPTPGLTYNLRLGKSPGAGDIITPHANLGTGFRRTVDFGNAQQGTSAFLNLQGLAAGTYYWSVQAVDTAFAGGPWADEQTVIIKDTDEDGLPDWWEAETGLDPNESNAGQDSDGDGKSNSGEFNAGTNPNDPASALEITQVELNGNDFLISFPSVAGKRYRLETSGTGPSGPWSALSQNIAGTGVLLTVVHADGALQAKAFYRVVLEP